MTDYTRIKVVILGDAGVGKSNLMTRCINDAYTDNYRSTIGVDFMMRPFQINNASVKLQFWDTAGHQRFRTTSQHCMRGSHMFLIVYSVTDRPSFENVREFFDLVAKNVPLASVLLVGNKCDSSGRVVGKDEGAAFAASCGARFIEADAKTRTHVPAVLNMVLRSGYNQCERE